MLSKCCPLGVRTTSSFELTNKFAQPVQEKEGCQARVPPHGLLLFNGIVLVMKYTLELELMKTCYRCLAVHINTTDFAHPITKCCELRSYNTAEPADEFFHIQYVASPRSARHNWRN
eukprot:gnl/TRDRNA2_/TRDRNA2_123685_c0_seq1.p1 gnl/TRDRNA2_/TRDRNA2_123685_c0~~gnl/TRDRNA2_/TRDRNA2_123685_c0_seq1.p1  ORF type:complete len:117 (-),score=12.64 gnl/TRDRNA2_/TRDRNA2_123685_c0_seq1:60-410(-)